MLTDQSLRNMARKDSRGFGVVGAGSAGHPKWPDYDVKNLIEEGYRKNVIVSACISMIATSAPEAPLRIYRETEDGQIEDKNHWFNKLIRKPNDAQSPFELWEYGHTYMQSGGTLYFELVRAGNSPQGEVLEMYPLRPDRMSVIPGSDQFIESYEYDVDGQKVVYPAHEILRIPFPDPLDEFNGLAPLKRVMRELGIDNEATDFTKTFFENAAVPYGLLTSEQSIGEPEADRIRWRWQKWFKSTRRFMTAVLGKGMTYQQMGMNFKDMEFESLRSMTETRLCAAFGVDPVLLPSWVGIKYGGKYSNYSEARSHLWQETIIPVLKRIESKITSDLLEDGVIAKFDLSEVKALQENENEKATRITALYQGGIIKKNEGREEMGYDEDPNGDVYANETVTDNNPENDNENDDSNSNSNNNDPDNDDDNDNKSVHDHVHVKKKIVLVTKDKAKLGAAMVQLYDTLEEPLKKEINKFFKKSKQDVVKILDKKQMTPEEQQEVQNQVNALAALWYDQLISLFTSQIALILMAGGSLAAGMMGRKFNGTSPEVVKYLEDYVPTFVQRFNETTKRDLQATMIKSQVEGWGLPRLKDEMKRVFNQYEYNRTDMVARSETVRSSNAGAKMAYKQAEVQELEWLDTDDERTCKFCKALDGKRIGIDGTFVKVGESIVAEDGTKLKNKYEPIDYPPAHPNCRCTVIPVVDEE